MSANNSQVGTTPSEAIIKYNENECNIDQLLSIGTIESSESSIKIATTNMIPSQNSLIPNIQVLDSLNRAQEGRRRRRRQQRQRRRERRRQQREQQQPVQWRVTRRQRCPRGQTEQRRETPWSPDRQRDRYRDSSFDQYNSEEESNDYLLENLLDAYKWEKMDSKERWKQQQINDLVGFAVLEQLELLKDQDEQTKNIEEFEKREKEEQQHTTEQLIQQQQWEQKEITFLERFDNLHPQELLNDQEEQLNQIEQVNHMEELQKRQADEEEHRNNDHILQLEKWEQEQMIYLGRFAPLQPQELLKTI